MSVFLETPRLVLRDKTMDDVDFLASLYADPRVMRWIGDGATYARDEVEARLNAVMAIERGPGHERWNAFKIAVRKDDGACLGQVGMLRCEIDRAPAVEIGWWLAPFAWGSGYATEAATALRDHAFDALGIAELSIVLHAQNARSVAVALRLGGTLAGPAEYRGKTVTRYLVRPSSAQPGAGARTD